MISRIVTLAIKYALPLVAILAIGYAIYRTQAGKPDDQLIAPAITPAGVSVGASAGAPASAPTGGATSAGRVAGSGVVEPSSEVITVAANSSGVIASVNVTVGELVSKGQILFSLDAREVASQLSTRTAETAALQSNIEVARAELRDKQALLALYQTIGDERAMVGEELLKRRGAVDLAQSRLLAAQAQVKSAQSAVQQTKTQLELLTVRSPLDATVLQVRLRPGEFASVANTSNQAALTLGKTTPLHVRVDFDEADVSRLSLGQPASVSARGASGAAISANFVRAEPVISPKRSLTNAADERVDTRVLQVIYALPADAPKFYVGQQIDAFVAALPAR